ncbi:MAG: N-acetylmuramoyl-L-alanine amidase [Pseudomonadota bacterium]
MNRVFSRRPGEGRYAGWAAACLTVSLAVCASALHAAAADEDATPHLTSAVLTEADGFWRLSLMIQPDYRAEVDLLAEEGRLLLTLPDVNADENTLVGQDLSLAPDGPGVQLAVVVPDAGEAADLRALPPRAGESMAFAIGTAEVVANLPTLMPQPSPRPTAAAEEPVPGEGRPFTVVIDPGHGGHDPGAVVHGVMEKTLTLVFARRLALRLDSLPEMRAVLTREGDQFLPLGARLRLAIAEDADLFISLHADTVTEGNASGLSVYTLTPGRRDAVAAEITAEAPRESIIRGVDLGGAGDDVTRILVDLAQRRTSVEGDRVAAAILEGMGETVPLLTTRPHRKANFRVLRSVDFPAILVELGFLSNEGDRKRLTDRRWQAMAADKMTAAIDGWRRGLATRSGQE